VRQATSDDVLTRRSFDLASDGQGHRDTSHERIRMFLRIDRWGTELPPPTNPDAAGANAVQELMGGRFGEMSTLMNYTFQSFNFRNRQGARPFFDLIANIAAEEYGHIEVVAATINTMLTGAGSEQGPDDALAGAKDVPNKQHC